MIINQPMNRKFLHGTTIVAIRTPEDIVIGADSKILSTDGTLSSSVCKIMQVDNFFFASAGLVMDTSGKYSVTSKVIKASQKKGRIFDIATNFESIIIPELEEVVKELKSTEPEYYKREIEGRAALEIVFFGIEDNVPVLYMRYFQVVKLATGSFSIKVHQQNCPGDCPSGIAYTVLGQHEAIDKTLGSNQGFWKMGLVEAIRKLIEIEISHKPKYVAPPIDILRMNKKEIYWVQKKSNCPELKKI